MSLEIILVFAIVLAALLLFVSGLLPVELTALLVTVSLMVTGILTPEEGVSGFSNPATLTVLALLIISEGLKNTGAVDALGNRMISIAGRREWVTLLLVMCISAFMSAFINTTAVVAIFIPVMFRISKATGIQVSVLLIPLSFSAMVGGASTMIGTSTNLLINAIMQQYGLPRFRIFDLTLMGGVFFIALLLFILLIGRHLLKKSDGDIEEVSDDVTIKDYLTEVLIPKGSKYIGKTIGDIPVMNKTHFRVLRIIRDAVASLSPVQVDKLQQGDVLVIKAGINDIVEINNNPGLQIVTNYRGEETKKERKEEGTLYEALVIPNSNLIDRKIENINFEYNYNAYPLAIKKRGFLGQQNFKAHKIDFGDILLMDGNNKGENYNARHDWVIIQQITKDSIHTQLYKRDKMLISILIIALVVGLAVTDVLPILVSAWLGVVTLFVTRCITLKKAYQNVEWGVFFLLAGVIPLGLALHKTGADQLIADFIVNLSGEASLSGVVLILFVFTSLLTGVISNQATAVLLVPIAINVAYSLGLPPEPIIIAVLFGANTSFLTPVGYQTNAMVFSAGNYSFKDFLKIGGVLCVFFWIIAYMLIPYFYG